MPDAQTEERRALGARRRQLIALRTAAPNRLAVRPVACGRISRPISSGFDQRLVALDDD